MNNKYRRQIILSFLGTVVMSLSSMSNAVSMDTPSIQNGRGIDACPRDSICLYAKSNYNEDSKQGNKILVIQEGGNVNDLKMFDNMNEAKSVVNNTPFEIGLKFHYGVSNNILTIGNNDRIDNLGNLNLNDMRLYTNLEAVITNPTNLDHFNVYYTGPEQFIAGEDVVYQMKIRNISNNMEARNASVTIFTPTLMRDVEISCQAEKGTCDKIMSAKNNSITLYNGGNAYITVRGKISEEAQGSLHISSVVESKPVTNLFRYVEMKTQPVQPNALNLEAKKLH